MKYCCHCNKKFSDDMMFCSECGRTLIDENLEYSCVKCGFKFRLYMEQYCPNCGSKVGCDVRKVKTAKKHILIAVIAVLAIIATLVPFLFRKEFIREGIITPTNAEEMLQYARYLELKNKPGYKLWYLEAAETGNAEAQYRYGLILRNDRIGRKLPDVYKDEEEFKWFLESAIQNHSGAQYELAVRYETGIGVTKDLYEALKWYKNAANNGNSDAAYKMGEFYFDRQPHLSVKYLTFALDAGNKNASSVLGELYITNSSVKDVSKAIEILQKAASKNDLESCFWLGEVYRKQEVVRNNEMAFKYYKFAADKGHIKSIYAIAECYQHGIGTKKSVNSAKYYYELANKEKWLEGFSSHKKTAREECTGILSIPVVEIL